MVAPVRHGLPAARTLPAQHESPPPGRLLQPLPPHVPQGAAQHTSALSFAPRTPPAAAQSSCGGVGGVGGGGGVGAGGGGVGAGGSAGASGGSQ